MIPSWIHLPESERPNHWAHDLGWNFGAARYYERQARARGDLEEASEINYETCVLEREFARVTGRIP